MSEKQRDYTDIPIPSGSTEEIVQQKKTRIVDNIAKVVTLLIAFLFWLYVFATNDATKVEEKKFELIPIEVRGSDTVAARDLAVQNMSLSTLDVTVKGTRGALSGVKSSDIKAYINISDIEGPGIYYYTVYYDIPSGLSDAPMSSRIVEITVDTVAERSFVLDASRVVVDGFVLPESCAIDREAIKLNASWIVIEGQTLVLDEIQDIRVRPMTTLTLEGNTTLSATVEAIDADGKAIDLTDCKTSILAQTGDAIGAIDTLTVTIPIYEEKVLPVVIREKNGLVGESEITLSHTELRVRATPDKMKNLTSIELDGFSADSYRTGENGTLGLDVAIPQKYKEYTITDTEGKSVNLISVTVTFVKELTCRLDSSYIKVIGDNVAVVTESVELVFRATAGNEALMTEFLYEVSAGSADVSVFVNVTDTILTKETSREAYVSFGGKYSGKLYAIGAYTVTLKPLAR